jgi:hypothetical protein
MWQTIRSFGSRASAALAFWQERRTPGLSPDWAWPLSLECNIPPVYYDGIDDIGAAVFTPSISFPPSSPSRKATCGKAIQILASVVVK